MPRTEILVFIIVLFVPIAIIYFAGLNKKWSILIPYIGMLLFASMGVPFEKWHNRVVPTFWLPVQSSRSLLFLASGCAAFLCIPMQIKKVRLSAMSWAAILLAAMGLYAALLRTFVHGNTFEDNLAIPIALLTLIPLLMISVSVMEEPGDIVLWTRSVMLVNAVWMLMCIVQFVINPKHLTLGNQFRFSGLLGNPQHAGAFIAFCAVISLWSILNDPKRQFKVLYIALFGVNMLALIWTASRTGLGMACIGLMFILMSRLGKTILLMPIGLLAAYFGMKYIQTGLGIDVGVARVVTTENTRSIAFRELLTTGMNSFWVGAGSSEQERSENSWLYGFASFGIVMLVLSILLLVASLTEGVATVRCRRQWPREYRPGLDLCVGVMVMYCGGAMFEGYMVARVHNALCFFIPAAGIAAAYRIMMKRHQSALLLSNSNRLGP